MTVESVEVVFENIQLPFSLEEKSMPFGKAWSVCVCVCVCVWKELLVAHFALSFQDLFPQFRLYPLGCVYPWWNRSQLPCCGR